MPIHAQCIDLADDPAAIEDYLAAHRAVPEAVERALREIGIERMEIFRHGTRLFMRIETREGFDPARDYQRYASIPEAVEWDARMRVFQRPVPGAAPGEWWTTMEPVYELPRT